MWMMPLHLHVNQKSDYDYDDDDEPMKTLPNMTEKLFTWAYRIKTNKWTRTLIILHSDEFPGRIFLNTKKACKITQHAKN